MDEELKEGSIGIRGDTIKLGQLIKVLGLVGSGADVKDFLEQKAILVNGEIDNRRGRKLHPGDVVSFGGGVEVKIRQREV